MFDHVESSPDSPAASGGPRWRELAGVLNEPDARAAAAQLARAGSGDPRPVPAFEAVVALACDRIPGDLDDVTLVGFSMGGGEVARYFTQFGTERLHSVVFASAVPPYLMQTGDNPDGPLSKSQAAGMAAGLTKNQEDFYDAFTTQFFSARGELKVTEQQRQEAMAMCLQADKKAALACMTAFGATDFRDDLPKVSVPTLVLHGDSDSTVPFEGSGQRTHEAIPGSELHVIAGAPHGCNVSHSDEFNSVLVEFLAT